MRAADDAEVRLVVAPPGCLDRGGTSINVLTTLFNWFEQREGDIVVESSGLAALTRPEGLLMAEGNVADGMVLTRFLEAKGPIDRQVLEADMPVLDSPWEITIQSPYTGRYDWLGAIQAQAKEDSVYPDLVVRRARLLRLTRPGAPAVLAVEWLDGPGLDPSLPATAWLRQFAATSRVRTRDEDGLIYSVAHQIAPGPRLAHEVLALGDAVVLHTGDLLGADAGAVAIDRCGRALGTLGVDALAPAGSDLALGADELAAFAKKHSLPFVASNLRRAGADPKTTEFPRFRLFDVGDRKVAVVGVVGRKALARAEGAAPGVWVLDDPMTAVTRAVDDIQERLRARPALTIVLASQSQAELSRLSGLDNLDLVAVRGDGGDMVTRKTTVAVAGRETTRRPTPSLVLRTTWTGFVDAVARFEGDRLVEVTSQSVAVPEVGPVHEAMHAELRKLIEQGVAEDALLLLPDPAKLVDRREDLQPLVYGDRVPRQGRRKAYNRPWPARYTDPLWMRLVGNVARRRAEADVALLRNIPRTFDMIGPISVGTITDWLSDRSPLKLIEVPGDRLRRVAERMAEQRASDDPDARAWLFAAGMDHVRRRIAGRPLADRERYRVVTTEAGAQAAGLGDLPAQPLPPGPSGLREVVLERLRSWPEPTEERLSPLLDDVSGELQGRWTLAVDELAVTGGVHTPSDDLTDKYAETREQRALTPSFLQMGVRANVSLAWDGPQLGWRTQARTKLDRLELDVPGQEAPVINEPADDVLLTTELQLNAVRVEIGGGAGATSPPMPLVPLVGLAYDTEFTATKDPLDPTADLPHQKQARAELGFLLKPGPRLREVRLAATVQADASEDPLRRDFGVSASYALGLPLIGPLVLSSEARALWLAGDSDDAPGDLALRLTSSHKLALPVALDGALAVFTYADVHAFQGKIAPADTLATSAIFGAGLQLGGFYVLR